MNKRLKRADYAHPVRFYRNDKERNEAMEQWLRENGPSTIEARGFTDDEYLYIFEYINMPERKWHGDMEGVKLTSTEGKEIIFATWTTEESEYEDVPGEFRQAIADELYDIRYVINKGNRT